MKPKMKLISSQVSKKEERKNTKKQIKQPVYATIINYSNVWQFTLRSASLENIKTQNL